MREFKSFAWKDASFKICSSRFKLITEEIIKHRVELEEYIKLHPDFLTSLVPVGLLPYAPESAKRMQLASQIVGVGPMAAVAGTMAQLAVEKALDADREEVIVENGGDMYMASGDMISIGIYAGKSPLSGKLAFKITPDFMPLSLCSSSSKMGHSKSFGNCDLVTVVSSNASIADAAATWACNQVKSVSDVDRVLEEAVAFKEVKGVLIIKDAQIGLIGELPKIVKNDDNKVNAKVTHHQMSNFME